MSKVYIFFADGFEDIEGLTVVDLMRRAGIDIQTVSIKETREIRTSHGINILTDCIFSECDFSDADMLVIPGGMPGTKYLEEYKPLTGLLTSHFTRKAARWQLSVQLRVYSRDLASSKAEMPHLIHL